MYPKLPGKEIQEIKVDHLFEQSESTNCITDKTLNE